MKKILFFVSLICTLLLAGTALANNIYPKYLGGNHNYILVDGHMGTAWYVDRSSLYVGKYAPPQYIIAINVCTVNDADRGNTAISRVFTQRFFYNWDLRRMYVDQDGNSNWRYLDPSGAWYKTGIYMPAGEMAFYLAYHMRFYGSRFSSDFYPSR